jgi:hypothetical protein
VLCDVPASCIGGTDAERCSRSVAPIPLWSVVQEGEGMGDKGIEGNGREEEAKARRESMLVAF